MQYLLSSVHGTRTCNEMTDTPPRSKRAAADRTRAWREAQRVAGHVKIEIWAPAACRSDIQAAARAIIIDSSRGPALSANLKTPRGLDPMDAVIDTPWTIDALKSALDRSPLVRE